MDASFEDAPPQSLWNHGCCDVHGVRHVTNELAPPQSLWNHGCCDRGIYRPARTGFPASISLESRVLRQLPKKRFRNPDTPPQSLWNHGCCDRTRERLATMPLPRLNLFGITGAATSYIGSCDPATGPPQSLWNHGCCDAHARAIGFDAIAPPQSLWNHGCCDINYDGLTITTGCRLNLFGITGAATLAVDPFTTLPMPASISLESRVLRRARCMALACSEVPPQSLWNHGCCDAPLAT